MLYRNRALGMMDHLRLTPYQLYILELNGRKYDLRRLVKRGDILYAPYRCDDRGSPFEYAARMLMGPRADLIGADRMLVKDQRGIKIYHGGFYSAHEDGVRYYADSFGNRVRRNFFARTI